MRLSCVLLVLVCLLSTAFAQRVEKTIWLPDSLSGVGKPTQFLCNPATDRIYVGGAGSALIVVDGATYHKVARVPVGGSSLTLNPGANRLYVLDGGNAKVEVVDLGTNTLVTTVPVGYQPQALCYNSRDNKLYASCAGGQVTIIGCATDSVLKTLTTGQKAAALCYDSANDRVYCANPNNSTVSIISGPLDSVVATDSVGGGPGALVVNSTDDKVYCAVGDHVAIIDGSTGHVVRQLSVAAWGPLGYNPVNDRVYSAGFDAIGIIDGVHDSVVASIPVATTPGEFAVNSSLNRVYCRIGDDTLGQVVVMNGATNGVLAQISVDPGTAGICCSAQGTWVYTGSGVTNGVSVIDAAGDTVVTRILTACSASSLVFAPDVARLYAGCDEDGLLAVIDDSLETLTTLVPLNPLDLPTAVCWNPVSSKVYVANYGDDAVTVVNPVSESVTARIATGNAPYSLCYNQSRNRVYSADEGSDRVSVIDGQGDTVIASPATGGMPINLSYNSANDRIYVSCAYDDVVSVIDCATNLPLPSITTGLYGYAIQCASAINRIYATCNHGSYSVAVIDGATDSVVKYIAVGPNPRSLCYCPPHNRLYVGNRQGSSVSVIDCDLDSVVATVTLSASPWALLYDSISDRLYCATDGGSHVDVIAAATNQVIASLPVEGGPVALAWSPARNRVYAAGGSTISVIDDAGGIEETMKDEGGRMKAGPTVVRGVLFLPASYGLRVASYELLDAAGRHVLALRAGANDVSALSPGVYFVHSTLDTRHSSIAKVVITK